MRSLGLASFAALLAFAPLAAFSTQADTPGGLSIMPPEPAPATAPATQPATAPAIPMLSLQPAATTQPTADSTLGNLLKGANASPSTPTEVPVQPALAVAATRGIAPQQPPTKPLSEGTLISNRVGRLVAQPGKPFYLFVFDADKENMQDPPMPVLPSRMLSALEAGSESGTRPVKFRISGQVTEYKGTNYLLILDSQSVRDFNQF